MLLPALRRMVFSQNLVSELLSRYNLPTSSVVVDFSSPNIAKTFHMGNFRSTILGNFLQRTLRLAGHNVVSINYLGDWGKQFSLLALYWQSVLDGRDGRAAHPDAAQWMAMSARERVELLTAVYAAAHRMQLVNDAFKGKAAELFVRMECSKMQGQQPQEIPDEDVREALELWREWSRTSREYFEQFYIRLGVEFDEWDAESAHVQEGARITDELVKEGKCTLTNDNYWAICNPGIGLSKITLRKGDGANVYLNRDLGAIYSRHRRYNADRYIYVVDQSQANHFRHLKRALILRGDEELAERITHLAFGRIIGLSSRQGKNDSVDYLAEQGEKEAREYVESSFTRKSQDSELPHLCRALSLSTLIFELMRHPRQSEFTFTFRAAFKPEQSNVLSLHKMYSRLNSLELRHADHMGRIRALSDGAGVDWRMSLENSTPAQRLARLVQEFDTVLNMCVTKMDPHPLALYLVRLSSQIGRSLAGLRVQDEPLDIALPRLILFAASKKVLGDGMRLLGIEPLQRI